MLSQSHLRNVMQSLDFREGSGNTLNDISGNNNHATVIGGTWTTDRFGRANRAILLDGVDDYIDLGLADYQGEYTVIISYKLVALAADAKHLFAKSSAVPTVNAPGARIAFRTGTLNRLDFTIRGDAVNYPFGLTTTNYSPATYDQWEIIAQSIGNVGGAGVLTANGKTSNFVNATTKYAYAINTNWTTGSNAYIGRASVSNTGNANVVVDRVMISSRRLSAHENRKIMDRLRIGDLDK